MCVLEPVGRFLIIGGKPLFELILVNAINKNEKITLEKIIIIIYLNKTTGSNLIYSHQQ